MAELDPQLYDFVHSDVSTTFGIALETVAIKCKNFGRFKSWLNSDVERIKKVLTKVQENGVSPALFASYEQTEGFNSSWGWLNHTHIKGSPIEDADYVSKWMVNQSQKTTDNPAWIDFANYKDFVPQDVKDFGNEDFKNMSVGSIGRVIIAGTAAATWEVYYPDGLKKEFNGVRNYGKPITRMMDTIIEWGGDIHNNDPDPTPDPDPKPDPDPDEEPDPPSIDFGIVENFFNDLGKNLVSIFEQVVNIQLYDYGNSNYKANNFLKLEKTFNNTYKLKTTLAFKDIINTLMDKSTDEIEEIIDKINPDRKPDPEPEPEPEPEPVPDPEPDNDMYFPVDYTAQGINFWHPPHVAGSVQSRMEFGGFREGRKHAGYDIGALGIKGNKVYAVRTGVVTFVGNEGTRGFVIRIRHTSDDKHTMYMHLVVNSNTVKVNDTVKAGDHIATMGDTPNGMYDIHLHIEVDTTGEFLGYDSNIDPSPYLKVTGNNQTDLPNPAERDG